MRKLKSLFLQPMQKGQFEKLTFIALTPLLILGGNSVFSQENTGVKSVKNVEIEEVYVTARRKSETAQDVPLSVNAVSSETLQQLNVRKLEDLSAIVAGLTLQEDSIAPNASVRGVRFDTFASGFDPTVEFYLNDAPINSLAAMQATFDIGQIEVLRGPQGTLRGRASPSGAITIQTERPDMQEFGGYVDSTVNNIGGRNGRFAVNQPIIEDVLALRIAGFYEQNDDNRVDSINSNKSSEYEGKGYRFSLRYSPVDTLEMNLMYQRITPDRLSFTQVESANYEDATIAAPAQGDFSASDRKAVSDIGQKSEQDIERAGLEVEWENAGLRWNYVGALTNMNIDRKNVDDTGDVFFGPGSDPRLSNVGQELETDTSGFTHELRVSSAELINDAFDYVAGILYQKNNPDTDLIQETAVFLPAFAGGGLAVVNGTPIERRRESVEKSLFANFTWKFNDATELSAGWRYISYHDEDFTKVSGRIIATRDEDWNEFIYLISAKYYVTEDVMSYVTVGNSWRPGVSAIGNFSFARSDLENSFITLDPEESESIEIGVKSSSMDDRLQLNVAAFYQTFDNYPYRSGGSGVNYVSTDSNGVRSVEQFNFVAAVPVNVYGLEVESRYQVTPSWNVGALMSYAKGEIDNGLIPCNDYAPVDGRPDSGAAAPTVADIDTATGNQNVGSCNVSYSSNFAPDWTTTLTTSYSYDVAGKEVFVRGLLTMYGASKNDPSNDIDDVGRYDILNLYTGVRDPEGKWSVMLYAKNVFDKEVVLSREVEAASIGVQVLQPPTFQTAEGETRSSTYRQISMNAERELGVNFRYNF
jgi:iron complex outermembrane receptor protein